MQTRRVFQPSMQRKSTASQAIRSARWRFVAFILAMFAATACSDAPLAPNEKIDQLDVERLMPSVNDAVSRLSPQIETSGIRDRVRYDLDQLHIALLDADARKVRFHTVVIADVLREYVGGPGGIGADSPDVDAIRLMLRAVSQVVHAGVQMGNGSGV